MKKTILFFLVSFNSFAGIGGSHGGNFITQSELNAFVKNRNYDVRSSQFYFEAGEATVAVPGINVCIDKDELKTIESHEIFENSSKKGLVSVGKDYLRLNLEEVRAKRDLNPEEDLKVDVQVYRINIKNETNPFVDSKYIIPNCSQ